MPVRPGTRWIYPKLVTGWAELNYAAVSYQIDRETGAETGTRQIMLDYDNPEKLNQHCSITISRTDEKGEYGWTGRSSTGITKCRNDCKVFSCITGRKQSGTRCLLWERKLSDVGGGILMQKPSCGYLNRYRRKQQKINHHKISKTSPEGKR